ncbi:hypothetical protein ZIOFF_045041 [Zingiber officinale]|uniref:Retrotransposon Copia-like N-terminal domain-containing protein n=1 Tax=Zingiber officinale TaxID=94328 RepID=A0A8J5KRM1_ZINOF|nr:hypothetical protein ZIOFF_045041 [Zingiber officinale]
MATQQPLLSGLTISTKLDQNNYVLWKSQILLVLKRFHRLGDTRSVTPLMADDDAFRNHTGPIYWLLVHDVAMPLDNTRETICLLIECENYASALPALDSTKRSTQYLQNINKIVDTLAAAGQRISDGDLIFHVLGGLGPEYESLVIALTTRPNTVSFDDMAGMLLSYEYRLGSLTYTPSMVNLSIGSNHSNMRRGGDNRLSQRQWQVSTKNPSSLSHGSLHPSINGGLEQIEQPTYGSSPNGPHSDWASTHNSVQSRGRGH